MGCQQKASGENLSDDLTYARTAEKSHHGCQRRDINHKNESFRFETNALRRKCESAQLTRLVDWRVLTRRHQEAVVLCPAGNVAPNMKVARSFVNSRTLSSESRTDEAQFSGNVDRPKHVTVEFSVLQNVVWQVCGKIHCRRCWVADANKRTNFDMMSIVGGAGDGRAGTKCLCPRASLEPP